MSDLAPRPRGGWQVGSHFGKWDHRAPSLDCYGVEWRDARTIVRIRHYREYDDAQPCCVRDVTRRPGESDLEMLARAYPPFVLCAREVGRSAGGVPGNRPADPADGVLHRPADANERGGEESR